MCECELICVICFFETTDATTVEALKGELAKAKEEAKVSKAAADKAAADLRAEQVMRPHHESRVTEVKEELRDAIRKCEVLEQKTSEQASKLNTSVNAAKEARSETRSAH